MRTTRRGFLALMASSGAALVLGVRIGDAAASSFEPNVWLTLDEDGSILVRIGKCELGQGVRTSLPMILAEELGADLDDVRIEQAAPGPDFPSLGTGGSRSLMRSWDPLRLAGAAAREMLVAAAAARWRVDPSGCRAESSVVVHAASGQRASFASLVADAARQPLPENPRLKTSSEYTLLGRPRRRVDGPQIVRGRAVYGMDVRMPGMLHAVVARPPRFGDRLDSFDPAPALAVPGVRHVLRIDRGVAVVADDTWSAIRGRAALRIRWKSGDDADFSGRTLMGRMRELCEQPGVPIRRDGDGRKGFGHANRTLFATYEYPWAAHASVEPVNSTAFFNGRHCKVWTPTQTPNRVQGVAARICGIEEKEVEVHVVLAGGGFGRRLSTDFDEEAVSIARELRGVPVHLSFTREDDLRHGHFQAPAVHRLHAGLDERGRVVEWEHRKVSVPHNGWGTPDQRRMNDPDTVRGWAWGIYDTPYGFPHAEMGYRGVASPTWIGPWRSVFSPSSVFARECFVDEVAEAAGRDPIELRLELLGGGGVALPELLEIGGDRVERSRMRRVIERARDAGGWGGPLAPGRALGFAASVFHTETYVAHLVEVSLRPEARGSDLPFRVHRVVCAIDCGLVVNPNGVEQQVEGGVMWSLSNMKNEITFEDGAPIESNYDDFPVAGFEDAPERIETLFVDAGVDRPSGVGEPVVDTVAPAVANAVSRLAGVRVRRLPVRPGDLLRG